MMSRGKTRPKSSPDINYEDIISRNTHRCQVAFLMVALHRLDFWYGKLQLDFWTVAKLLLPDFTPMSQYRVGANRKGFATFRGQWSKRLEEKKGGRYSTEKLFCQWLRLNEKNVDQLTSFTKS